MHVGRYKRLLSHSKGMEASSVHVVLFAPGKNGYDFFQCRISHRRHDCIGTSLSLSLSLSHTHTHTHTHTLPDRVAQSVVRLTLQAEVTGSIPGPATYFRFSFHGSCQLLAKVCARRSSLSRKSLVNLTNLPDMTIDVNRGRKTPTNTNTLFPRGKSTIPIFA